MPKSTSDKTDLEWVKKKLRAFVDNHEGQEEQAPLVLDALKCLGGLLVKSEPKRSQDGAPPGFLQHSPLEPTVPTE